MVYVKCGLASSQWRRLIPFRFGAGRNPVNKQSDDLFSVFSFLSTIIRTQYLLEDQKKVFILFDWQISMAAVS